MEAFGSVGYVYAYVYAYVYVCVFVYVYVYIYIYGHMYIYIYIYTYVHTHTSIFRRICIWTFVKNGGSQKIEVMDDHDFVLQALLTCGFPMTYGTTTSL